MPSVAAQNSAPSHLGIVLSAIRDLFSGAGDATPVMIGKEYKEWLGAGQSARALFVPEPKGKYGRPIEMGSPCSVTHSCNVYVRGVESGGDAGRFDGAYELGDRVMSAIARATAGQRETETELSDDSPIDADAYGADFAFSFTYRRDVRWDAGISAVAAASADTGSPVPTGPVAGTLAATVNATVTTTPTG